jgi:hypothetical protein
MYCECLCGYINQTLFNCRLSDNPTFKSHTAHYLSPFLSLPTIERIFRVSLFARRALSALGNEMFRLTSETRGGLFLIVVLLYLAFVFGVTLWIETGASDNSCHRLGSCIYTVLRLTFFDGNGLDYAFSLVDHHKFLFVLLMAYLAVSAFGVMNGLIGIFGTVFAVASEEAFVIEEVDPAITLTTNSSNNSVKNDTNVSANANNTGSAVDDEEMNKKDNTGNGDLPRSETTNTIHSNTPSTNPNPNPIAIRMFRSATQVQLKEEVNVLRAQVSMLLEQQQETQAKLDLILQALGTSYPSSSTSGSNSANNGVYKRHSAQPTDSTDTNHI